VSDFDIRLIGGRIGAEIVGADLKSGLTDAQFKEINAALLAHKALFFRDQHLDEAGQLAFAGRFGPLTQKHPTMPTLDDEPQVLPVDGEDQRANHWHTDVTFSLTPPMATTLRGIVIPSYGGNTLVANAATAYEDLPVELRTFADRLWAVHTNDADQPRLGTKRAEEYRASFLSRIYETAHPVVRVHPESGERSLFIGTFAQRIVGLSVRESRYILDTLQAYITRPENVVRWRWSPGDVLIFDNRNTQHYAPNDYGHLPRLLHRVSVTGGVPVGIDGKSSYVIKVDEASDGSRAATT
jgi:alpha-ketoglutarate-dependent sulfate ester dioxygenase